MEDRKVIEDYDRLIWWHVNRATIPAFTTDEDVYQDAATALLAAPREKLDLAGYASTVIKNQILMSVKDPWRKQHTERQDRGVTSIDQSYHGDDYELPLPSEESYADVELEMLLSQLNPKQEQVLRLRLEGYNQREIGEMLNVTQTSISDMLKRSAKVLDIAEPVQPMEDGHPKYCQRGQHRMAGYNLVIDSRGKRLCRHCQNRKELEHKARQRTY